MNWQDLTDHELVYRLTKRGMPPSIALDWVSYRHVLSGKEQIDMFLEEDEQA